MRISGLTLWVLSSCLAAALLAGCGGSQPSIAAPGATLQTSSSATHANRGESWMLPEAKSEDLLYADASGQNAGDVYVFSYPKGKLVGTIMQANAQYQQGLCSDAKGHVFVTTLSDGDSGGNIYEYAHGETTPVNVLSENGVWPWGCSVDPSSGDLAVTSINLGSLNSFVEVYRGAGGTPKLYSDNTIINYMFCGYDNKGNLFIDGSGSGSRVYLAELPRGSGTLADVTLDKTINWYGQIQWDGTRITIEDRPDSALYRLKVSGSTATIVGTTPLKQWTDAAAAQSWIQNGVIIQPNGNGATEIGFWRYPAGGNPITSISSPASLFGVTVSIARH